MANYELQIRANGYINKHKPYLATATASHASKRNARVWGAATFRAQQASFAKPYAAIASSAWTAPFVYRESPYVTAALTFRAAQSTFWKPLVQTFTASHAQTQPLAIREKLFRPIVMVNNDTQRLTQDVRLSGSTSMPIRLQPPTEVYVDSGANARETVDTLKTIVWWGGAYDRDYVYIEYAGSDDVWRDVLESQTWVIAEDGAPTVTPTFSWDAAEDPDEDQAIAYDLIVAFDFALENVAHYEEGIPGDSPKWSMQGKGELDADQVYFWAVRTRDQAGDVSAWSLPRTFRTYQFLPPQVKTIGGVRRLTVPYKDYKYDWQVGNLPAGTYKYAVHRVSYDAQGALVYKETVIARGASRFYIEHGAENPPEILNVVYDEQSYRLKFDVRLQDSLFRLYDLKSVSFADQKEKALADDAIYYMDSFPWKQIPLVEVIGSKKDMPSNPYLSTSATLSWAFNDTVESGKNYAFDVKVMSEPEERTVGFRWGWRAYAPGESVPTAWTIQDFDAARPAHYRMPQGMNADAKAHAAPYFGKANPSGIVMNKTYFDWSAQRAQHVRWDFALFPLDSDEPLRLQESLYQPYAAISPQEFFELGITNVLLDLTGIEDNHYELRVQEIDKVVSAIRSKDFYWKVRASDGLDASNWSTPERSRDFNIHHFEWDVRNRLEDFKNTNFLVLKVEIKPSVAPRQFEYPYFQWLNISNPAIEQLASQIGALWQRRGEVQSYLHPYYDSYIAYLKSCILAIRNKVLEGLIAEGYFADASSVQNFAQSNLHSLPVAVETDLWGVQYSSELDIHDAYLDRVQDLHRLNPLTGAYDWSPTLYTWRMDKKGGQFKSQKGRPLRSYDLAGLACENKAYVGCYLSTGSERTCPWFGRKDLGFCNGFVSKLRVSGMKDASLTLPGVESAMPDPNVDPEGFKQWLASYSYEDKTLGEVMQELARNPDNLEVQEVGFGFDQGSCPMAVGADRNTPYGGPCAKYKRVDRNFNQRHCEVCGSERQPQFLGMERDHTAEYSHDVYSDINPAGFAGVEIRRGDEQVDSWEPIAQQGQSRNPQQRFTGVKLKKTQLPGENNSDFFDTADRGIANPFFTRELGDFVSDPPPGAAAGNWHKGSQTNPAASQIIERI